MLAFFSDFGWQGPYVGQVKAVLAAQAPGVPVIDLMHDAPCFSPRAAAYLLAALVKPFPTASVFLCVVDPGVGDPKRRAVLLEADGNWFVAPDNGLLNVIAQRASRCVWRDILWRPEVLSASFHGRDLFAPVAAMLANGNLPESSEQTLQTRVHEWPSECEEIIYIDHYGNAMTGVRAAALSPDTKLQIGQTTLLRARTFSAVPQGQGFWYENAHGLVEIAVNQGSAARQFALRPGSAIAFC